MAKNKVESKEVIDLFGDKPKSVEILSLQEQIKSEQEQFIESLNDSAYKQVAESVFKEVKFNKVVKSKVLERFFKYAEQIALNQDEFGVYPSIKHHFSTNLTILMEIE